jgi:hypothetical protein
VKGEGGNLMMFRRKSLASYVMLGGTISPKEVMAVDKEYVRVNSTELGEEVEIDIADEDDFNIKYKLILRVDTVEQDPSLYCIKISTNHPLSSYRKLVSSEAPVVYISLRNCSWHHDLLKFFLH